MYDFFIKFENVSIFLHLSHLRSCTRMQMAQISLRVPGYWIWSLIWPSYPRNWSKALYFWQPVLLEKCQEAQIQCIPPFSCQKRYIIILLAVDWIHEKLWILFQFILGHWGPIIGFLWIWSTSGKMMISDLF